MPFGDPSSSRSVRWGWGSQAAMCLSLLPVPMWLLSCLCWSLGPHFFFKGNCCVCRCKVHVTREEVRSGLSYTVVLDWKPSTDLHFQLVSHHVLLVSLFLLSFKTFDSNFYYIKYLNTTQVKTIK